MKENRKKLDIDDLENVTGGIEFSADECLYFMNASGRPDINICDNCFFYHKIDDEYVCDCPILSADTK